MANPNPRAQRIFRSGGPGEDFIQFTDSVGNVLAWIDPNGDFQGAGNPTSPFNFPSGVTPSGTMNGTNTEFTLPSAPSASKALFVFLNGIFMAQGTNYTLVGTTITMVAPIPEAGDNFIVF